MTRYESITNWLAAKDTDDRRFLAHKTGTFHRADTAKNNQTNPIASTLLADNGQEWS
jgi:hypothetical protein